MAAPAHLELADLKQLPPPWLRSETEEELPHLKRVGELDPDSPDTLFEFSLDVCIDGIAARAAGLSGRSVVR